MLPRAALAVTILVASCAPPRPLPSAPAKPDASVVTQPPPNEAHDALVAARAWLAAADRGDYAACWNAAAPELRGRVNQAEFTKILEVARASAGAFRSRDEPTTTLETNHPGAPPGRYATIVFDAHYDVTRDAVDEISMHREADGRWTMAGYQVRPAACREPARPPPTTLPPPPPALALDAFYTKIVEVDGIPVVSSSRASDHALLTARTIVHRLLRKRPDVAAHLAAEGARIIVMASAEQTLDVPEYKWLSGTPTDDGTDWNDRARGLGGTTALPLTSAGEENLLCLSCDRYAGGSVLVHELAHTIEQVGLARDRAFRRDLEKAFANATTKRLFQGSYPGSNKHEYWAVGAQSWFEANEPWERRSRAELAQIDPQLAALLARVFDDSDAKIACGVVEEAPETAPTPSAPLPAIRAPRTCPGGMVSIAGGAFADGPLPIVQPFCIDATEVTVAQYGACVRAGRCAPAPTTVNVSGIDDDLRARFSSFCNGDRADRARHPINCVDWRAATAYCRAEGKRLPTEQEWEWAARGGPRAQRYPWGSAAPAEQLCWSGRTKRDATCEVGSFPNGDAPGGIHDLAGNVWEWTSDVLDDGVRVTKGNSMMANREELVRVTSSDEAEPDFRAQNTGFRCAR